MAPTIGDFFTAVPGTIHATTIPAAVGEILVRNDSPYDLWIAYNNQPSAAPSPLTFSQYAAEVTPGREQIVPPPQFNGRMWIGCYDPGGKASSGTISNRANVYVRWYPLGESAGPGAAYSALTGLDSTSQQRAISIPVIAHTTAAFNVSTIGQFSAPQELVSVVAGAWSGTQVITIYLYSLLITLRGVMWAYLSFAVAGYNAAGGVGFTSQPLADMALWTRNSPLLYAPPNPVTVQFTPPAAATRVSVVATALDGYPTLSSLGIATISLSGYLGVDVDLLGQTPPPSIGNGAGTPPGVIY